ncbi:MAG: chalcone isomerase family protein [Flavobacteriales bacterium]|nr:chalcone isomerase family protein [Flavobacteriales bacterium]
MKKFILTSLFLSILFFATAQKEIGGITIPSKIKFNETTLNLNGAGIREKFWIDLYVGGLYTDKNSSDAATIINSDETMSIKLHIISSMITTKKMTDAVDEGFKKSTKGKQAELKDEITKFKGVFTPEIKEGDVYDLVYIPNKGTVVYKNSKPSITIKGLAFKKALFGIWLCDEPADEDLKEAMLGK